MALDSGLHRRLRRWNPDSAVARTGCNSRFRVLPWTSSTPAPEWRG